MRFKRLFPLFAALLIFAAAAIPVAGCGEKPSRTTTMQVPVLKSGPISGQLQDGVWTYLGIPYAAPPVGELRWREPQPVTPWEDVRSCTSYGPACPQPESDFSGLMDVGQASEDCLYLNVWTPAESPDQELPVMVWIHGGSFTTGAGSIPIYDGHNLAEKGAVIVTINYRLGPLGFMAHPQLSEESPHGVSGNYGLEDQASALEWVQGNIEVFGGDPDRVTVFGESAGGMSILDLMASPLAAGLFDRAIVESGPFLDLGLPLNTENTLKQAEKTGEDIAKKLGCDQAGDTLACLREKTPEELIQASSSDTQLFSPISLGPNVDGYVLPDNPSSLFAAGKQYDVPLLIGTNADEGTIFAPDITPQQYRLLLNFLYGNYADAVYALYPAGTQPEVKPALDNLITQMGFAASASFTAASMAKVNSPAYMYQFTRIPRDPRAQTLGAFHGLEIVYVFGNSDKVGSEAMDPADLDLSRAMMDYWTSFATSGDPNGQGVPEWPAYLGKTSLYQELGDSITTKSGLYQQSYDLVMKKIGQ